MRALPLILLLACHEPADEAPGADENFGVAETDGDPVCDNLSGVDCMMPFPSDFWRRDGQLALDPEAAPESASHQHMAVDLIHADGFGVATPVMFRLAGATVVGAGAVFDAAPSLGPDAHTVLIDSATGQRVPHWIETDWLSPEADPAVIVLRPAVPLPPGARIVVGVRGLVDASGAAVEAPPAFAALRDGEASTWIGVHDRRARYEADVFPVLEAAGLPRAELQLAWDFTVRSQESATRDLATVQARLYDAIGADGPTYQIDTIQTFDEGSIAVIADGVAQVPSFLEAADASSVRRLRRDGGGLPSIDGYEEVPFRIQIPRSVIEMTSPAPVLQYGHGFLGGREEADNGWLRDMANENGFVILASDMQGMSSANAIPWALVLTRDAGRMQEISDEPMQGLANHLALQRMMKGRFQRDTTAELHRGDGGPAVDPERVWYHGNSQGGTMGNLVVTLSRDVTRGGLGVPGCCFPFLLDRSVDFDDWAGPLSAVYPNGGDLSLLLGLLGTAWDRLEGLTWAPHLAEHPLPDTPAHRALLHVGLEDAQVQNDASWILARAMHAVQPAGQVAKVWEVPEVPYPIDADVTVVNWDFGVTPDPTPLDPPNGDTDTHGRPRALHEAQQQLVHFLQTGEVVDTCSGGPCLFP